MSALRCKSLTISAAGTLERCPLCDRFRVDCVAKAPADKLQNKTACPFFVVSIVRNKSAPQKWSKSDAPKRCEPAQLMDYKLTVNALHENRMLEMTNENFARLLRGLTIAVGNRSNRILLYQFLAAEIRALHCSYGVGDGESYKRALTFLENCERYTLRSLVRRSAKHHAEVTVDHAKRVFSRALKKLDTSQGHNPTLRAMIVHLLKQESLETNSQPSGNN